MKQQAAEFLSRKDLRQKIRRELSFGLFPKTLKGKLEISCSLSFCVPAGKEQQHTVQNAFKTLINEGFLRDKQGVHSLEVVQEFYKIIKEEPRKSKVQRIDLNKLCQPEDFTPDYQAIVLLIKENSQTSDISIHIVEVSKQLISMKFFLMK